MIISEKKLRRIVNEILNEFRLPEKNIDFEKNKMTLSSQEVSIAIDKAIGKTHASGRKFHPAFLNSLNESKQAVDMTDEELEKAVSILVNMVAKEKIYVDSLTYDNNEDLESPDLEIIKSIMLFTSGHVPTVRSPESFDLKNFKDEFSTGTFHWGADKADYSIANKLMTRISSLKRISPYLGSIFRGMRLDENVVNSLAPGIEFNNWPISSWTIKKQVALRYSQQGDENKKSVVLVINKCNYGCKIDKISDYEEEAEYVLGKKLIIKKIIKKITHIEISCEVID
jgi:hypothetical protein